MKSEEAELIFFKLTALAIIFKQPKIFIHKLKDLDLDEMFKRSKKQYSAEGQALQFHQFYEWINKDIQIKVLSNRKISNQDSITGLGNNRLSLIKQSPENGYEFVKDKRFNSDLTKIGTNSSQMSQIGKNRLKLMHRRRKSSSTSVKRVMGPNKKLDDVLKFNKG